MVVVIEVSQRHLGTVLSYKLRYIVGFGLVEMAISTNPKPTINRKENTDWPGEEVSVVCTAEVEGLLTDVPGIRVYNKVRGLSYNARQAIVCAGL